MIPPVEPRFRLDSLGKRFRTRAVLKCASAWASPGRITLLVGRNGSGKTTLLRCGLGLTRPDFGSVFLDGRRVNGGLSALSRSGLAYLPDRGLLSPRLSIRQHLAAFAQARGGELDLAPVESLRIGGLLDSRPSEMSGGERRRCEICLATAAGTYILIADEPLLGIAPTDRRRVAAALRSRADAGCALVVTGHEVEDLFEIADEVVWMVAGTTHGLGSPEQAARHHQFRVEYLGARCQPV